MSGKSMESAYLISNFRRRRRDTSLSRHFAVQLGNLPRDLPIGSPERGFEGLPCPSSLAPFSQPHRLLPPVRSGKLSSASASRARPLAACKPLHPFHLVFARSAMRACANTLAHACARTHLGNESRGEVVKERDEAPPLEDQAQVGINSRVEAEQESGRSWAAERAAGRRG